jgi:hypothetical protein
LASQSRIPAIGPMGESVASQSRLALQHGRQCPEKIRMEASLEQNAAGRRPHTFRWYCRGGLPRHSHTSTSTNSTLVCSRRHRFLANIGGTKAAFRTKSCLRLTISAGNSPAFRPGMKRREVYAQLDSDPAATPCLVDLHAFFSRHQNFC